MKRFLFYFVHPAKFHLFRDVINKLLTAGHEVEVIITGRDILEELVRGEGWKYTLIFPNGRKIRGVHIYLSAAIFLVLTVLRLFFLTWGKRYSLFVSDDLLSFVGRVRGIPSIFVTDDDLRAVPESVLLVASANHVFAPDICALGKYEPRKIGYRGFKALAHLHPRVFTPDKSKLDSDTLAAGRYFFIRTVSATSTHDVGKQGINDDVLRRIVHFLQPKGKVIINSERALPSDLEKFVLKFNKADVAHYLAHAAIFISDSTTMCAEAAMLGTPSIEIDTWHEDFRQYTQLHDRYQLLFGFYPAQIDKVLKFLNDLFATEDLRAVFSTRRDQLLAEKIDVSAFLYWIVRDYPDSVASFNRDSDTQLRFK
jgi:predicted glycosyltransferase